MDTAGKCIHPYHPSLRAVGFTLRPVGPAGWKRSRKPGWTKPRWRRGLWIRIFTCECIKGRIRVWSGRCLLKAHSKDPAPGDYSQFPDAGISYYMSVLL